MASLSTDKKTGTRRILFLDADNRRRTIRLSRMSKKAAESVKARVEHLIVARTAGVAIDADTARWVADLGDDLHDKLARVGLVTPREACAVVTLEALLDAFDKDASHDVKATTRVRQAQARRHLIEHFGPDRDVSTISANDGDGWRTALLESGYAKATVSRTIKLARQFFRWGLKRGLVTHNPFLEVKAGNETNPARLEFIDRDTVARVMDMAPSIQWRLLIALSRFSGLRVPSEAFRLRWADVDWDRGRLYVRSPKTEHHDHGAGRHVPIFPEVRDHLLAAFEQAEPGTERVLSEFRVGYNPHTELRRLIIRAGVKPWPRTWHNLRASRQSELVSEFPIATACEWLGNSKLIAAGHYVQTLDADWQRAIGGGAQSGAESGARAAHKAAQHASAPHRRQTTNSSPKYASDGTYAAPCGPVRDGTEGAQWAGRDSNPGPFACKANALAN
jgi:integrase